MVIFRSVGTLLVATLQEKMSLPSSGSIDCPRIALFPFIYLGYMCVCVFVCKIKSFSQARQDSTTEPHPWQPTEGFFSLISAFKQESFMNGTLIALKEDYICSNTEGTGRRLDSRLWGGVQDGVGARNGNGGEDKADYGGRGRLGL